MITINWKTYKQLHNKYSIDWLVKHGYLEEVKENKEMNRTEKHSFFQKKIHEWLLQEAGLEEKPLSQKRAEAIERGKEQELLKKVQSEYKIFKESEKKMLEEDEKQRELFFGEPSILEKLREEMERKVQQTIEQIEKTQQIRDCERLNTLREILDLLTSLETKEESVVNYCDSRTDEERARDAELYRTAVTTCTSNVWTPTPWQEIEVSNDGERWYKKEFTHTGRGIALADKTIYFYTTWLDPEYNDGRKLWEWWKFARPIEDKIEPELPEFSYDRCDEENNLVEQVHEIGVQVEALTTFCQALARQKTTK